MSIGTRKPKKPAKPSVVVEEGLAWYRTRVIDRLRAVRYARMIAKNGRYIVPTGAVRPDGKGYRVTYRLRHSLAAERLQRERYDRAVAEMSAWIWNDAAGTVSTPSGGTYKVTDTSCTCIDDQYTCQGLGIMCKHRIGKSLRQNPVLEAVAGGEAGQEAVSYLVGVG